VRIQRSIVLVVAVLAVVAAAAPGLARAADTLPGLNETLTGTISTITGSCDPAGTSTIHYTVSGAATGAYPGTFTETGVITIGPASEFPQIDVWSAGPVTTFDASFTIDSALGAVQGTKHQVLTRFDPATSSYETFGFCATFTNLPFFFGSVISGEFFLVCMCGPPPLPLAYSATITTPDGKFHDEGGSGGTFEYTQTQLVSGPYNRSQQNIFQELFFSSGEAVRIPSAPVDKSECKDGGWKAFDAPAFKNQGDCVSFVETGGTNPPG
jgi:hypothetical protein